MTSLERVVTTLGRQEPDRVPLFLFLTTHGAREVGLPIRDYYTDPQAVVEGQLRLRQRFPDDVVSAFAYAAVEVEARGGDVLYRDDGPPNSGAPIITCPADIDALSDVDVENTPCLARVLESIRGLKAEVGGEVPIVGVVISPLSLPIMQMGFGPYLDLLYSDEVSFGKLMETNARFCVAWANAQVKAGATAICYFDPLASGSMLPSAFLKRTGFPLARQVLEEINGPTCIHLASGRVLPTVDSLKTVGADIVGVSSLESLSEVKRACGGELAIVGNLNAVALTRATPAQAREAVRSAIQEAGPGGGFILSDNHGEIPYQVPDEVLTAIVDAVQEFGVYPIETA